MILWVLREPAIPLGPHVILPLVENPLTSVIHLPVSSSQRTHLSRKCRVCNEFQLVRNCGHRGIGCRTPIRQSQLFFLMAAARRWKRMALSHFSRQHQEAKASGFGCYNKCNTTGLKGGAGYPKLLSINRL
jgi:hypothetical protein